MSWLKVVAAIAITALGAALIIGFPGLSPEVAANLTPAAHKGDLLGKSERIDRPAIKGCGDDTWSYYDLKCQKTRTRTVNGVRTTRIVPRDPESQD
jgi:hypothetical protein